MQKSVKNTAYPLVKNGTIIIILLCWLLDQIFFHVEYLNRDLINNHREVP